METLISVSLHTSPSSPIFIVSASSSSSQIFALFHGRSVFSPQSFLSEYQPAGAVAPGLTNTDRQRIQQHRQRNNRENSRDTKPNTRQVGHKHRDTNVSTSTQIQTDTNASTEGTHSVIYHPYSTTSGGGVWCGGEVNGVAHNGSRYECSLSLPTPGSSSLTCLVQFILLHVLSHTFRAPCLIITHHHNHYHYHYHNTPTPRHTSPHQ